VARLFISGPDVANMRPGDIVRLIGLFNVDIAELGEGRVEARFHSEPYEVARERKAPLIHWLPIGQAIDVEVLRPEGAVKGLGEPGLAEEPIGALVQLVRYGFGRVDAVSDGWARICYAHN